LQKIIENWNERATIFNGTEKFIKKIGDFCPQKDTLQFGVVKFIGSGAKKVKSVFLKNGMQDLSPPFSITGLNTRKNERFTKKNI